MAGTQIFVRNREGKVFGPIEPSTVELLIEGGVLQGLLQVSTDGERYALPFRFPELRDFFPRHLWGDDSRKDVQLDAEAPASSGPGAGVPAAALFGGPPGSPAGESPDPVARPAARSPTGTFRGLQNLEPAGGESLPVLDPDEASAEEAPSFTDVGEGLHDEPFVPPALAGP